MNRFAILLLLAAILVPSMLGYVKKSRELSQKYEEQTTQDWSYGDYEDDYEYDYDYDFD